jgi:hypothetical protein
VTSTTPRSKGVKATAGVPQRRERRPGKGRPLGARPPAPLPTLRVLETRVLRGANVWARRPVIRMVVDLGVLEEFPSNTVPGFNEALVALLPTL